MNQLILVGAVNVFSQSIIIGVTNSAGGSCNAVLGKSLVLGSPGRVVRKLDGENLERQDLEGPVRATYPECHG